MQKLIPVLKNLLIEKKVGEVKINQLWVDPYQIGIKVWCTRYLEGGIPSNLPFDYEVQISILNVLTASSNSDEKKIVGDSHVFLEDLRTEIVRAVSQVISVIEQAEKEGTLLDIEDYLEIDDTKAKQFAVENHYRKNFSLTGEQLSILHMFHSPFRIPLGYTEEEVKLCIMLYPTWKAYVQSFPGTHPPTLHASLFEKINEAISRTEALKNAVFQMYMDILRHPPPVPQS